MLIRCVPPTTRRSQRGFSMIEVLVTLLIIALALLGTAGLQAYSMRMNQGGQFRTQAVFLVADLTERMEANKNAISKGAYALALSNAPNPLLTSCTDAVCTCDRLAGGVCSALALYDLSVWQNTVAATLPQSSWSVVNAGGNPSTVTVTVSWVDRRADTTNAAFDNTSQLGSNAAGSGERFFYTASRTIFDNP